MTSTRHHSKPMSGENGQLFLPTVSKVPNIVRLPTLLEPDVKAIAARRPRSERCLKTTRLPYGYGLPSLNDHDSNFIPSVVERPKTTGKRPNTSESSTRNSNLSPAEKQTEISIFKLSKYRNLIKPEMKVTKTAISSKEFSKSSILNKNLLDEHVAREKDSFDKHESKKTELVRWLHNSGQE
ncbi:Hypothetical predicted protein [Paramuricea clavata]|uniref:Uncharacterized protein n=1 Tax=Paramuricea clavata TaxID=317549 RepID=A0A7D9DPT3_PARCT|nr:Hypothetical predicted protein [Paramuricea clavata]